MRPAFFAMVALILALLGALLFLKLGPGLETRFAPVRVNNANLNTTRTPERVCWTWASDKVREAASDDVDTHLDVLDLAGHALNTFTVAPYHPDTGLPWQSGRIMALGHSDLGYCVDIPRSVQPSDRIRVRFTPVYHGWHDLWTLPIQTPDIVDPSWAEAPR